MAKTKEEQPTTKAEKSDGSESAQSPPKKNPPPTKKDGTQKVKKTITKPKKEPAHPPVSQMVQAALTELQNRKGVSFTAIKQYLAEKYNCEYNSRYAPVVRKYISKEYEAGRIKMADQKKEVLNFSGRFKLVA